MSERRALEARLRAVEAALDRIGTSTDERRTARELVRFLVVGTDRPGGTDGPDGAAGLCDAAAVEADGGAGPERVAAAGAVELLEGPGPAAGSAVWGSDDGQPLRTWTGGDPAKPVHGVVVPLIGGAEPLGRLLVVRTGLPYDDHELATLHYAARLAGVHIGYGRRLAAVEDTAAELQRALVAEPGRPHPNLEIASRYLPLGGRALVGGDWFETVRLHFGRTLLVIGDVMGHGIEAAVDMNAYRAVLREIASTDLAPHRVLRQMDALAASDANRRPATCLLVRIDPARGTALYASAGHLPPVLFGRDGPGLLLDVPVGPPLGTGIGGYEALARPIDPDQTLLLYTDGLVERRGEDIDVSLARLTRLRVDAGAPLPELVDSVCDGLGVRAAEDDVAAVAARPRARGPHRPEDSGPDPG
ncbi:PP2C family protein-serine/threonine phosphatase [Streptomyces sp. NPDC097619]|uniref:PP2C family protein-serine/threonine phosphatase n=1 Tax=Streptomyces sp. NPDC097619 TaxID=3157228 RepID=UPI003319B6C8